MTPHCCNWQPGAGGRSHTSFEPCMRGRYRSLSRRHDLARRDGRSIRPAAVARARQYEATSHTPSPLLYAPYGQHSVFHPPLHLVTLHHLCTPPSPDKSARSPLGCHSHRRRKSPSSVAHHSRKGSTAVGSYGQRTPSTFTSRQSRRIAFHVLDDSCPNRSAHLASGPPCWLTLGMTHTAG